MTPSQLARVKAIYELAYSQAEQFCSVFYEELFKIDPQLRPLFRSDIKLRDIKFMKLLKEVVQLYSRSLISLPATSSGQGQSVIPGAYWAGKQHYELGVKIEDFATMKQALFFAFEHQLGDEFTAETREAWSEAYDIVGQAMQSGLHADCEEDAKLKDPEALLYEDREAQETSALFKRLDRR